MGEHSQGETAADPRKVLPIDKSTVSESNWFTAVIVGCHPSRTSLSAALAAHLPTSVDRRGLGRPLAELLAACVTISRELSAGVEFTVLICGYVY